MGETFFSNYKLKKYPLALRKITILAGSLLLVACGPSDSRLELIESLPYSTAQTPPDLTRQWNDEALKSIGSRIEPRRYTGGREATRCDLLAADPTDRNKVTEGVAISEMNPRRAIRACLAAVSEDRFEPRHRYQLARAYGAAGELDRALPLLKQLSDENYTAAKEALGQIYVQRGRALGLSNLSPAMRLLEDAASNGSVQAKLLYGQLLMQGAGGEPNAAEGLRWMQEAAADGHPLALRTVGHMLLRGGSDLQDPRLGAKFLADAAELNDPESTFTLSLMRRGGVGIARDDRRAFELTRQAAEWGHPVAQAILGGDFLGTSWVSEDIPQAYFWLSLAEKSGVEETTQLAAYARERLTDGTRSTLDQAVRVWRPQSNLPDFAALQTLSDDEIVETVAAPDPTSSLEPAAAPEEVTASATSPARGDDLEEPSYSFSDLFGSSDDSDVEEVEASKTSGEFQEGDTASIGTKNEPTNASSAEERAQPPDAVSDEKASDVPEVDAKEPGAETVASESGTESDSESSGGFLDWFNRQLEEPKDSEYQ